VPEMFDKVLKPIHDGLNDIATTLKGLAEMCMKLAEELHTYDGSQTTLNGGRLPTWRDIKEKTQDRP
jgi:hypothetical protein